MKNILLNILGPFGWPKYENELPPLMVMGIPRVYLETVKHQDGFLPYGVGITRRPVRSRFMEHTRKYVKGEYNILDLEAAQQGIRKVLWKGWGWTLEKRADYDARKTEVMSTAQRQMLGTHIFIIDTGRTQRLLERLEALLLSTFMNRRVHCLTVV
jgi:hypothetical protein